MTKDDLTYWQLGTCDHCGSVAEVDRSVIIGYITEGKRLREKYVKKKKDEKIYKPIYRQFCRFCDKNNKTWIL